MKEELKDFKIGKATQRRITKKEQINLNFPYLEDMLNRPEELEKLYNLCKATYSTIEENLKDNPKDEKLNKIKSAYDTAAELTQQLINIKEDILKKQTKE